MIRRIRLIRNIGQFSSVDSGQDIDLDRLVLVYAENGRGKTTITAIFRSLTTGNPAPILERHRLGTQHPPHVVLDCDGCQPVVFQDDVWNNPLPNLTVFDDVFVDENIHSGLIVNAQNRQNLHELVLGVRGVSLSRRLQELVSQIEQHNRNLNDKSNAIPEAELQGMSVDEFCDLAPVSDIDSMIESATRELSAAQNQTTVRNTPIFESIELPPFDIEAINQLLVMDLPELDAASESKVHDHFEAIGPDGEQWISNGMQHIMAMQDIQICPFCAQDLTNSNLLTHYRAYFNEGYVNLKQKVTALLKDVADQHSGNAQVAFERSIKNAIERRQLWAAFCEVPDLVIDTKEIGSDWSATTECVLAALTSKQSAPLDRMRLEDDAADRLARYQKHRKRVADLSDSLIQANNTIIEVKEQAYVANIEMIQSSLAKLIATKARYTPDIVSLCNEYLEEKKAKDRTEKQRDETRTELRNYQDRYFPYNAKFSEQISEPFLCRIST